jgi:hypothetical protein
MQKGIVVMTVVLISLISTAVFLAVTETYEHIRKRDVIYVTAEARAEKKE